MRRLLGTMGLVLLAGIVAIGPAAAQIVNEGDPVFLRFPDLRKRYFESSETKVAMHKFIAMPMPKQCAYFYVDVYSKPSMSDRDTREDALRNCRNNLQKYGPLGENYAVPCDCRIVIGRDKYRLDPHELPTMGYAPLSLFYRDSAGRQTRLHGYTEFGLQFRRGESGALTVYTPTGNQVCTGSITIPGAFSGNFSLNCPAARFTASGQLQFVQGQPKDHTIGRGATPNGGSVTMVVGLPSGAAQARYGTQ
ncbi:hypothetical protein FHP25_26735 [Vineibacter terrae]|uniref:Uncharacterized protein n=1 Tax=Vineibacter terrae TaxID=2586908 RepID=A0A5C8PEP0_9HYPH|nr:hypothetical protein [Vineibacter terrae]TXL72227.1 hypothetical protein FHP25_26735 [Vineibacter terrae]